MPLPAVFRERRLMFRDREMWHQRQVVSEEGVRET
jgi:hypothetical protein